jgi:hypothetical protein
MSNIFLSIPVLSQPELNSIQSVYKAILSSSHVVRLYWNLNDSLISRVRCAHVSAFYYDFPEADFFMSIDSDIEICNVYKSNNLFNKLVAHDLDFVGGLYALKRSDRKQCSSITIDGKLPPFDSGLVETPWLSTGCSCIKRSAVKKMIEAYPELEYSGDDNMAGKRVHALYLPMLYDLKEEDFPGTNKKLPFKKFLSEDWSFAQRWKQIGGKIFADTSIVLNHIGKQSFSLYDVEPVPIQRPNPPPAGFDLEKK